MGGVWGAGGPLGHQGVGAMQVSVRIDKNLDAPALPALAEARARFALTRLMPRLLRVTVSIMEESQRGAGCIACRISGVFSDGGDLHVSANDDLARAALNSALAKFRRTALRTFDRQRAPVGLRSAAHPPIGITDGGSASPA